MSEPYRDTDSLTISHDDVRASDLSKYIKHINTKGAVSFRLTDEQFDSISFAVKEYRAAKKEHGFDRDSWIRESTPPLSDRKAIVVFTFILLQWNAKTLITTGSLEGFRTITLERRSNVH